MRKIVPGGNGQGSVRLIPCVEMSYAMQGQPPSPAPFRTNGTLQEAMAWGRAAVNGHGRLRERHRRSLGQSSRLPTRNGR
jgi:hypothetical protein